MLGVVLAGKATEQLISAYRYYKEVVSSTAVTASGIYSEAEITMLSQLYARTWSAILSGPALEVKMALFVDSLRHDLGLGLIPAGAPINFTGHSLGGHVATLLAAMVATNDTTHAVGQVCTYNAPGQDAIPNEILNWLGIPTGTNGGVLQNKIINVIGEGGLNITAGLGSLPGPKQMIFIESEGWSTGNPILINNHSVVKQSDSLAVYALFAKIDPSLNSNGLDTINTLLKASSNIIANSLEAALAALGKLYGKTYSAVETNRDDLYNHLNEMQAVITGTGTIVSLVGKSTDALEGLAKNNDSNATAYRYALKELNPFAVLGANYSIHNTGGKLDLYNAGTGEGELTDQYLTDRALFLTNIITANLADTGSGKALRNDVFLTDLNYFEDKASGLSLQESNPLGVGLTTTRYVFGSDGNDTYFSGDEADHLYGGGGMDSLDGGKGSDYLEGNAGSDILTGGEGLDTLIGGAGDDLLDGGKGSDTLIGGLGDDTYKVGGGNGWDWLDDQGGVGKLLSADSQGGADIQLTGGTPVESTDNVWKQESNGKTLWYLLTDWTENGQTFQRLSIEGPDGGVFIKNWSAGQLGITLPGAPQVTPPTPVLIGTAGTDKIEASLNEGVIIGNGGADQIAAGLTSAATAIYADAVINDLTQYVANTANLTGGGTLSPGALQIGSALIGRGGDDTMVGGANNDVLLGGSGRDLLVGGGGADLLLGDGYYRPDLNPGDGAYLGWRLDTTLGTFGIASQQGGYTEPLFSSGDDLSADADIIHGGGGNDMAWGGFGDMSLTPLALDPFGAASLTGSNSLPPKERRGNDYLDGGTGNDSLWGGGKDDELIGGDGVGISRHQSEMLRSTWKNGQKRNVSGPFKAFWPANDDIHRRVA